MASQGPLSPGTLTSDSSNGGAITWTNPTNASASDNVYATASLTGGSNDTYYLKVTNYGFSIPSGATINGILVEIERKYVTNAAQDEVVKLVKGGTVAGNNKAIASDWPTSDTYQSYGSSSDLWGLSFTDTDINASNFGVVLSAFGDGIAGLGSPNVDHIRITVTYTPSGPTDYTILATQGSYTLTGQIILFTIGRVLTALFGSYALTGQVINFLSSGWTYINKSFSNFTINSKNNSLYSNTPKRVSAITTTSKNNSSYSSQTKNTDTFINQTKH